MKNKRTRKIKPLQIPAWLMTVVHGNFKKVAVIAYKQAKLKIENRSKIQRKFGRKKII